MKTPVRKSAAKKPERRTITFPGPSDWKALVRDLELSASGAHQLELTLRHLIADLDNFDRSAKERGPRDILVTRLKRLGSAMTALEDEIRRSKHLMIKFLPSDSLQAIGELMSYSALEKALDVEIQSPNLNASLGKATGASGNLRITDIEQAYLYQRQTLGLKRGPELLEYLVNKINAPMTAWMALNSLNKGGRSANFLRQVVILYLADASLQIIGKKPTSTAGGAFITLCTRVFYKLGLEAHGLEKAIERVLKKRREDLEWQH